MELGNSGQFFKQATFLITDILGHRDFQPNKFVASAAATLIQPLPT
jgi:hypothetical protein